jgi:uncharacterized membrane protein YgdD (TMEM256/DUF423 family)
VKFFRQVRFVSLAAAIIAVLAALGTLSAHHRSVAALTAKNEAILSQGKAFDAYNRYEAKQIRYTIYQALLAANVTHAPPAISRLESVARSEQQSSPAILAQGEALEAAATADEEHSETLMQSYETLQFATTFFEVAIVFVSLAALTNTVLFFPVGCLSALVGIVLFSIGLVAGR